MGKDTDDGDSWYARNRSFVRTLSAIAGVVGFIGSTLAIVDFLAKHSEPIGSVSEQREHGGAKDQTPTNGDLNLGPSSPPQLNPKPPEDRSFGLPAEQTPPPSIEPPPKVAPPPTPTSWTVASTISVEHLSAPDESQILFPTSFFLTRLKQELGTATTSVREVRVGVAFVEPFETRRLASGGTVIGYLLVSLPTVPGCARRFGGQAYSFSDATTAIMKAINDQVPDIANWIRRASDGSEIICPN